MLAVGSNRGTKDLSHTVEEEKSKNTEEESKNVLTVAYGQTITFLPDPERDFHGSPDGIITLKRVGNHLVAVHNSGKVGESYAQQITNSNTMETARAPHEFVNNRGRERWW